MKEEYDERSNGRDSQTKVIYDHSTLKVDFRFYKGRQDQTQKDFFNFEMIVGKSRIRPYPTLI